MSRTSFDFIIIGAGAAGLQLLLSLLEDEKFGQANILLLDKDKKLENDKTWCFWEDEEGPYEEIVYRTWSKGQFYSKKCAVDLDMGGYTYKMLRAIDFYNHARAIINSSENVTWVHEEVVSASADGSVITANGEYEANWVFDSRIPDEFTHDTSSTKLLQHFLGWIITFEEDVFDPESFLMMDYRDNKEDATSFTYILPFDKRTALVEFTLFSAELLEEVEYESYLSNYIKQRISNKPYQIKEIEQGVIPMSDYRFYKHHDGKVIKIGTAGGWVKPSSGYSFKISQTSIKRLLTNLKEEVEPSRGVARGRYRLYDSIFLRILDQHNEKGELYFETMYTKLPGYLILKFLDEKTTLGEDIRIMSKYTNFTFTKAFFQQLLRS